MTDTSGMLWLFIDVALVLGLAVALVIGIRSWRKRSRDAAVHRASEQATRRLYDAD